MTDPDPRDAELTTLRATVARLEAEMAGLKRGLLEMEAAAGIAEALAQDVDRLEGYLPSSKRSSNVQRVIDSMKARGSAIRLCIEDARAALGEPR